jgi:mono/diheme cytochrome c family protein
MHACVTRRLAAGASVWLLAPWPAGHQLGAVIPARTIRSRPVLAVGLFVAFWVLVAFSLVFVAARGGLGGARATLQRQTRGANRLAGTLFAVILVGVGLALPAALLIGNHARANAQFAGAKLTAGEKVGRELFGVHCAVCHTLAAANAIGKVGPNLDMLKAPASLVLHTIDNGCLPNAPSGSAEQCLGQGVMPAGIVADRDAQNVANFVARVAGKE